MQLLEGKALYANYKSSRDMLFSTMLVAGMDVDCSAFSGRIPFSVVIHIDRIIENYLTDWIAGKDIPPTVRLAWSREW